MQSLGVGPERSSDVSRITLVVPGTDDDVEKLLKQARATGGTPLASRRGCRGVADRGRAPPAQVRKLYNVLEAVDLSRRPFVERELMLVKARSACAPRRSVCSCGALRGAARVRRQVAADMAQRAAVLDMVSIFRAKVCDISSDTLTIETTGDQEKLAQLQELLEPYGILEARVFVCAAGALCEGGEGAEAAARGGGAGGAVGTRGADARLGGEHAAAGGDRGRLRDLSEAGNAGEAAGRT